MNGRALAASLAMICVAACGGGGSDGGGSGPAPGPEQNTALPPFPQLGEQTPYQVAQDTDDTLESAGENTAFSLLQSVVTLDTGDGTLRPNSGFTNGGAVIRLEDDDFEEISLFLSAQSLGPTLTRTSDESLYFRGRLSDGRQVYLQFLESDLIYGTYGYWRIGEGTATTASAVNPAIIGNGTISSFVSGYYTPRNALPEGEATYKGFATGFLFDPANPNRQDVLLQGEVTMTAEFDDFSLSGTMELDRYNLSGNEVGSFNTLRFSADIGGDEGALQIFGDNGVSVSGGNSNGLANGATGDLAGAFFGPNAEEFAAIWSARDGNGVTALGNLGTTLFGDTELAAAPSYANGASIKNATQDPDNTLASQTQGQVYPLFQTASNFSPGNFTNNDDANNSGVRIQTTGAGSINFQIPAETISINAPLDLIRTSPSVWYTGTIGMGDDGEQTINFYQLPAGLSYSAYGMWSVASGELVNGTYLETGLVGAHAYGLETPAALVSAATGAASYSGTAIGLVTDPSETYQNGRWVTGNILAFADFDAGEISGNMTLGYEDAGWAPSDAVARPEGFNFNTVSFSGNIVSNRFSADAGANSVQGGLGAIEDGYVNGRFFGPALGGPDENQPLESAGDWGLIDDDGVTVSGAFGMAQ